MGVAETLVADVVCCCCFVVAEDQLSILWERMSGVSSSSSFFVVVSAAFVLVVALVVRVAHSCVVGWVSRRCFTLIEIAFFVVSLDVSSFLLGPSLGDRGCLGLFPTERLDDSCG